MRVLRGTALAVAGALLSMTMAACGSTGGGADAASPPAAGAYPKVIEHAMGTTKIPAPPKRVVALDQSFVDAALTLDTEVVGYTTYRSITDGLPAYLEPVISKARSAVPVGTLEAPSLEKIAALKPDLILSAKVRHEALYAKLSQIAPTVFSETTGAAWKDNLRLVGRALGKEDLAEQRLAEYQERAKKIGERIAAKNGGTAPTVSIIRFAGEPTVRLYVENSYSGLVLKDAGLVRPKGQPTTTETIAVDLSEERIPDMDADHIFVSAYDDPSVGPVKEKFEANPLWGRLKGQLHEVSDTTWMTAVGIQGAHSILDDLASTFGVDPARQA
ncbi:ABC transporter substrate-binding protein [Microbispora sp. NPDC049125]|uniref:ABC transporter substrate-binding protein n=1 Tax=Microbispora sp. NPDC049125 TaxID=3154929 RepID=UPI0034674413